ncbi:MULTISPECIES: hypothetical protein [Anaeromyxobacter]|uniref:hypothetical protein n=1 Tax=Anaeromyxobacter TaxID=161492 RepID=UPI001F5A96A1|nr:MULTISPECIES: hypothetical protein [unclassified Anaeromyxobacter]
MTRRAPVAVLTFWALAAPAGAEVPAPATADAAGACALHSPQATASSAACVACHPRGREGHTHPVDFSYAQAQAGRSSALRDPAEVARRQIRLPEGEVRCATCHDADSPWAAHVALPPGAEARLAPDPRAVLPGEDAGKAQARRPRPGEAVATRPLCVGCHVY